MDTTAEQAARKRACLQGRIAAVAAMRAKQWQQALDILGVEDATLQDPSTASWTLPQMQLLELRRLIAQGEPGESSGDDSESSSGSDAGSSDADSDVDTHESQRESDDNEDEQQQVAEEQNDALGAGVEASDDKQQQELLQQHQRLVLLQQQYRQLGHHTADAGQGTAQTAGMAPPPAANPSTAATSAQHPALLQESCSSASLLQPAEAGQAGAGAGGVAHRTQPLPVLSGIQVAASSFSLSRSDRALLRQQLSAGLEQQRAAQALEKALASDPMLSMSLS